MVYVGFAVRAVIKHFANNDASLFKSVRVRFVKHVFPGETLITEMWKVSPTTIVFRVKVAERGEYVLGNAAVELRGPVPGSAPVAAAVEVKAPAPAPAAAAPAAGGAKFKSEAIFAELKKRADPALVKQVGVIYRFDLTAGGSTRSWLVDLKNGSGSVAETKADTAAECAIIISDDDFVQLMAGKLNAQNAFMKGQIKIKGNMMLAQKLKLLSSAPQAKL
jgi:putative sterol carrier protein